MANDRKASLVVLVSLLLPLCVSAAAASVRITKNNFSYSFKSEESAFAKQVPSHGISVYLLSGVPNDGCSALSVSPYSRQGLPFPFVLLSRGNCSFTTKVLNAQNAGFNGTIIYNNEESSVLITMAGASDGVNIYAVFVSQKAGVKLSKYAGDLKAQCWIAPAVDNTAWSVLIISMVAVSAIIAIVVSCILIRRHRLRRRARRVSPRIADFLKMKSQLKTMPILVFKGTADPSSTEDTCTICLEDYVEGERLRILPCSHRFHVKCIDAWLTTWHPFCPLCRRDSRTNMADMEPSECTPLMIPVSVPIVQATTDPATLLLATMATSPQSPPAQIPTPNHNPLQPDHLSPLRSLRTSAQQLPLVPPAASLVSRHASLQSLGTRGGNARFSNLASVSLEAFRASPFFPSLPRNPSSHISGSRGSTSLLS